LYSKPEKKLIAQPQRKDLLQYPTPSILCCDGIPVLPAQSVPFLAEVPESSTAKVIFNTASNPAEKAYAERFRPAQPGLTLPQ